MNLMQELSKTEVKGLPYELFVASSILHGQKHFSLLDKESVLYSRTRIIFESKNDPRRKSLGDYFEDENVKGVIYYSYGHVQHNIAVAIIEDDKDKAWEYLACYGDRVWFGSLSFVEQNLFEHLNSYYDHNN